VGVCALILAAPAAAHVLDHPAPAHAGLEKRAAYQREVIRHDRLVIAFFEHHRWMLARYNPYRPAATRDLRFHRAQLARTSRALGESLRRLAAVHQRRLALRLEHASPAEAIRTAFGPYWHEALAVARCESGLSVGAQNGQYLGLFQMGTSERTIYGHGDSAWEQARAASRYFMASGRDWSPWSCKP